MRRVAAAAALVALLGASTAAQRSGLTGATQVARVYDAIMDARFDQAATLLTRTCAPAQPAGPPAEVCQLLDLVSLWWQIQLDPNDRSRDAQFQSRADAVIGAMDAWTMREPRRGEAWFYLGGAYGARAQWRVLRAERVGAARDGKRIKETLEQALALDPGLQDAWFGIGLYHYYADVAPAAAKVLRFLLMLPGGNKAQGMQEMLRARNGGQLLRDEADYQLHLIDLWYEKRPERALELMRGLHERHPRNPHFLQVIAEIEAVYLHDATASLRSWRELLDAARARRVAEAPMAEARARLGLATQFDRLYQTDLAIDELRVLVEAHPGAPYAASAQAQWQLGQALDRLGYRDEAVAAYRAAITAAPAGEPAHIADQARAAMRAPPDRSLAVAYRLSLEAWRALERGAVADARRVMDDSLNLHAGDAVTRYRHARILEAQQDIVTAIGVLETVIGDRANTPPTIYADACAEAARLYETTGNIAHAIELYRSARIVDGADQQTKTRAARALARLTTAAPSR